MYLIVLFSFCGLYLVKYNVGTSLEVQWLRLFLPGQGAKIPCTLQLKKQNIKQKQYCNKFNKFF